MDVMEVREVSPDYNLDWVPLWAKGMPILKVGDKDPPYTYADWLDWPLMEGKVELLDGLFVSMATPTPFHAGVEGEVTNRIRNFLRDKQGRVFNSRFAVRLFPESNKKEDDFTVEPDIVVVLDTAKINDEGCQGAPDFIAEILSPSTRRQDLTVKLENYKKAGVREYWIIDPEIRAIQVCLLKDGEYCVNAYEEEKVPVAVLPGLEIDFAEVFAYAALEK
jgi:Uma2 family endonuclease